MSVMPTSVAPHQQPRAARGPAGGRTPRASACGCIGHSASRRRRRRLDQGESIKAVAEWLGHTDPAFTLATYTHLMPSSAARTKSAIASVYGRRPGAASDGPATAQDATEEA